jgi:hypothetical protein
MSIVPQSPAVVINDITIWSTDSIPITNRTIICISPHPDDSCISAGATLRFLTPDNTVLVYVATDGKDHCYSFIPIPFQFAHYFLFFFFFNKIPLLFITFLSTRTSCFHQKYNKRRSNTNSARRGKGFRKVHFTSDEYL